MRRRDENYALGWERVFIPFIGPAFIFWGVLLITIGWLPGVLETILKECGIMHENCKRPKKRR